MSTPQTPTSAETAKREAHASLTELFTSVTPLVEAHTSYCNTETRLRPTLAHGNAPSGRSPLLVSKTSSRTGEAYDIKTTGIAQWKMFGMVDEVSALLAESPIITATDEMRTPLDAADASQRRNIAHLLIKYPSGASLYWSSVSGINIHCPSRQIFNQFAAEFKAPERTVPR